MRNEDEWWSVRDNVKIVAMVVIPALLFSVAIALLAS